MYNFSDLSSIPVGLHFDPVHCLLGGTSSPDCLTNGKKTDSSHPVLGPGLTKVKRTAGCADLAHVPISVSYSVSRCERSNQYGNDLDKAKNASAQESNYVKRVQGCVWLARYQVPVSLIELVHL